MFLDDMVKSMTNPVGPLLTLIGTGHIFDLSGPLRAILEEIRPAVVAVELDRQRLQGLLAPPVEQLKGLGGGSSSLLYRLLAVSQQQLASSFTMRPGAEMLTAVKVGWEIGARVMLIDMEPRGILRKAWRKAPIKEKARFLLEIFKLYVADGEALVQEIEASQGDFTDQLEEFANVFPSFKPELVDRRDKIMAQRLKMLLEGYESVAAVVGDGHIGGLASKLEDQQPRVVRLKDLMHKGVGQGS